MKLNYGFSPPTTIVSSPTFTGTDGNRLPATSNGTRSSGSGSGITGAVQGRAQLLVSQCLVLLLVQVSYRQSLPLSPL